jgi:hypothetical protein
MNVDFPPDSLLIFQILRFKSRSSYRSRLQLRILNVKKLYGRDQAANLSPSTEQHEHILEKTKFKGMKHGISKWLIMCSKCTKTHLRASEVQKIFLGSLSLAMRGGESAKGEGRRGRGGRGSEARLISKPACCFASWLGKRPSNWRDILLPLASASKRKKVTLAVDF